MEYKGKLAMASRLQTRQRLAAKEKNHYRHDPGHRRKPGPGWTPTEAGWTKPRPGREPAEVRQQVARELLGIARLFVAVKYEYFYGDKPPGSGWEPTDKGWRRERRGPGPGAPGQKPKRVQKKVEPVAPEKPRSPFEKTQLMSWAEWLSVRLGTQDRRLARRDTADGAVPRWGL
jgi:hypothetical protein